MAFRRVVSLVFLWQLAASVCYYAVFAATPFFRAEYGLSSTGVGFVVTALSLGYAVFLLPLGALTDRFGERRVLTAGLLGLSLGSLFVAGAWSYPSLLVAVFLLGSLYGTAMPGTNRAVFDRVPAGRQNLAMGLKQVGVTAGSGASALLVTGIASALFWEAGFLVAAGAALVVAGTFWLAYARDAAAGTAEFPGFRRLSRNRSYRALVGAGVFLGASLFTTIGYVIVYVDEVVGASVAFGGAVLAALQVAGSLGRIGAGWLSDRPTGDRRRYIGAILLVQAVGSAALFVVVAFVEQRLTAAVAFVALGFFVLGFTGVYYSCMATVVSAEEMGGATGGGQLALTGGALVAPPAFGFLADAVGYRASWLLLAACALVAAGFVVRVVTTDPPVDVTAAAG